MRTVGKLAVTGVAALLSLVATASASPGLRPNDHGCPRGYVCIYPRDAGWNNNHPSYRFYYYGVHNLHNQFGTHRVFNNQYDQASANLCPRYNTCFLEGMAWIRASEWGDYNLTPVNSISLVLA